MAHQPRELRTERLLLRPVTSEDLPTVLEIHSDPETQRHSPSMPTEEQTRTEFARWQQHWAEHGFGHVVVVHPERGEVVGLGGLQFKDLDGEVVLNLYYRFRPSAWGNGYAPEMAEAVMEWAARALPGRPVVIITDVTNTPAKRVAEKLGFHEYKKGDYRGSPAVFYRREQ